MKVREIYRERDRGGGKDREMKKDIDMRKRKEMI